MQFMSNLSPQDVSTILLVEDNPISSKIQTRMLENKGLHVEQVTNGYDALVAVKAKPYSVVLMDINMPILGGYEAAVMIREWEESEGDDAIKIIALTANAIPEMNEYKEKGIDYFIKKPLTDENLEYIANLIE